MNEADFDKLVREHHGLIWKVCKTFFRNEEDQKDLFQDILYKLWKGKDSFQQQSKVSTWIYRIGLNEAIDKTRMKKKGLVSLSEANALDLATAKTRQTEYDIEALYLAIDQLKPLEKALILLYLEQETYRDIAEVIGISEKNVSVKLVRIKEKLKGYYLNVIKNLEQHGT